MARGPWLNPSTRSRRFAELDLDRAARRGYPEAVYCEGKTAEQVRAIAAAAARDQPPVTLFTRAATGARRGRAGELPDAVHDAAGPAAGLAADAAGTDRRAWWSCWPPAPPTCRSPGRRCSPRAIWAGTPSWSSTSGWPDCTGSWRRLELLRAARVDGGGRRDGRCAAQRRRRAGAAPVVARADVGGLRRGVRGAGGAAGHAQRLRTRASPWSTSTTVTARAIWPPRSPRP